jgi:GNAT superfamily N-acetyltransferase
MNPREVFERYARHQSKSEHPGFIREVFPGFVRLTPTTPGGEGFIQLARLTRETVDAAIEEQKTHFESIGFGFEWKHHDFDTPDNLREPLLAHCFKPGNTEALMVLDVAAYPPWRGTLPPGVRVERIATTERIPDVVAAHDRANDEPWPPLAQRLEAAFDTTAIFCAYDGDVPIGTGWVGFPPGSEFSEIHGGAVVAEYRGNGIYSALFDARVQEARRRGSPYIVVDAGPMSRPILLRKGFEFICETTPYRMGA